MINAYTVPQDEYFEWEDVMDSYHSSDSHQIPFLPHYQVPSGYYSFFENVNLDKQAAPPPVYECHDFDWTFLQSDSHEPEPIIPLLNTPVEENTVYTLNSTSNMLEEGSVSNESLPTKAHDDLDIMPLPIQNVDYLAHSWHNCEADLWASRRYLKATRKENAELEKQTYERLRNASWRAAAAGRLNLKKVDPKSFQWNKEHDVTWLHGPFVKYHSLAEFQNYEAQTSSATSDQHNEKQIKSILKHPSLSESLLRGSTVSIKTRKRHLETTSETETTRRKNLRFSCEVLQEAATPGKNSTRTITPSSTNYSTVYSDNSKELNSSPSTSQDSSLDYICLDTPTFEMKHKSDSNLGQSRYAKNLDNLTIKTACSSFSSHSPVEQLPDEVVALSRALRDVVDAHQRGFQLQQYQVDMPLWPTITA